MSVLAASPRSGDKLFGRARTDDPVLALIAVAALLAAAFAALYLHTMPAAFDAGVYACDERRGCGLGDIIFDSDGEFIPRQFAQGKTYTHNAHLLYHVAATVLVKDAGLGIIAAHELLSAVSGGLGVAVLFLAGWYWSRRWREALLPALVVGVSAGYWYFSATIDTYVPHVAAASLCLFAALACLRAQSLLAYGALGAAVGVAALLRTDGVVCALLAIVALDRPREAPARLAIFGVAAALVGVVGYALLAQAFYGVGWAHAPAWALDRAQRSSAWGNAANLDIASLGKTLVNHVVYAVFMPKLGLVDGQSRFLAAEFLVALWVATLASSACLLIRGDRRQRWLLVLAAAWIAPRVVLYAWWDPHDPFLYAALSLPGLWLLLLGLCGVRHRYAGRVAIVTLSALAVVIFAHNWTALAVTTRELTEQCGRIDVADGKPNCALGDGLQRALGR